MLRQTKWGVQNKPIKWSGVLPVTTLYFQNFVKSWFDVPATQTSIFILFVNAGVLFEDVFPCEDYP